MEYYHPCNYCSVQLVEPLETMGQYNVLNGMRNQYDYITYLTVDMNPGLISFSMLVMTLLSLLC